MTNKKKKINIVMYTSLIASINGLLLIILGAHTYFKQDDLTLTVLFFIAGMLSFIWAGVLDLGGKK